MQKGKGVGLSVAAVAITFALCQPLLSAKTSKEVNIKRTSTEKVHSVSMLQPRYASAERYTDPLKLPVEMERKAQELEKKYKSDLDLVKACFDLTKVGGGLNIKPSIESRELGMVAKTAKQVFFDRKGDSNEISYLLSGMMNYLEPKRPHLRSVFVEVLANEKGEFIPDHMCAAVLLVGDVPENLRYKVFEENRNFRSATLKKFGLSDRPGLHMIILDPTKKIFGAQYQKVIPLDAKEAAASYYRDSAVSFRLHGKDQDAIRMLRTALFLDPDSFGALYQLALIYQKKGLFEEAKELYKKATVLDVGVRKAQAFIGLGKVYFQEENYKQALGAFEKAKGIDPSWPGLEKYLEITQGIVKHGAKSAKEMEMFKKIMR